MQGVLIPNGPRGLESEASIRCNRTSQMARCTSQTARPSDQPPTMLNLPGMPWNSAASMGKQRSLTCAKLANSTDISQLLPPVWFKFSRLSPVRCASASASNWFRSGLSDEAGRLMPALNSKCRNACKPHVLPTCVPPGSKAQVQLLGLLYHRGRST